MNDLEIDGSYNARYCPTLGSPWLIRSAHLDAMTPAGEQTLRRLGLSTVIDLRDRSETAHRRHTLPTVDVPIYAPETGAPATGTLEQVYASLIADRGTALTAAVREIASARGPVLVHCAAGKDRTGLVIALVLEIIGLDRAEVIADYAASASAVGPARTALTEALLAGLGLDDAGYAAARRLHLDSPAEAIEFALAAIDARGGAAEYVRGHGLEESAITALRERHGALRTVGAR